MAGSCIGAAAVARFVYGKLDMQIMLYATMAGGVIIGTSSDLVTVAWGSMLIGLVGGVISALGFAMIGPILTDLIGLHDTCGVHSVHGMPGVVGGLISVFVVYFKEPDLVAVN